MATPEQEAAFQARAERLRATALRLRLEATRKQREARDATEAQRMAEYRAALRALKAPKDDG